MQTQTQKYKRFTYEEREKISQFYMKGNPIGTFCTAKQIRNGEA